MLSLLRVIANLSAISTSIVVWDMLSEGSLFQCASDVHTLAGGLFRTSSKLREEGVLDEELAVACKSRAQRANA